MYVLTLTDQVTGALSGGLNELLAIIVPNLNSVVFTRVLHSVLSMSVFVRFYRGGETAGVLWFLLGSPCCALGLQTLTYEQRGNYQHSL